MSNFGPMMILTSSTRRWSPHLSMMIALARARTEPKSAVRLGLIIGQIIDLSEDIAFVGITIDAFG